MRKHLISITVYLSLFFALNLQAQNGKRNNQFDFWIGEWVVEWTDQNGNLQQGTNSVHTILNNKVVEENFSAGQFSGKSVSVYDSSNNVWKQTWVDNSGGYMNFTGGMEDDRMILYWDTKDKEGNPLKYRMIFYDIEKEKLKWNWEKSADKGENWTLTWKLDYKRK